jgi:intracellular sulfur oxidation DsrE/DsrF family protein
MKKILIIFALLLVSIGYAQEKPVKIVFDVTSSDPATHKSAVRHVKFMSEAYPDSEFELVGYSGSLDMFLTEKSTVREEMEALINKDNVSFKVCAATMKRYEASNDDLIKGVESVPDGIMEIITKQQEGWGYIKEAHN